MNRISKIVLAYSGGLDTSVILKWLKETYKCPVVAFCADIGQGEEVAEVADKARATGADEVLVEDMQEEFVRDFVFPMLRAKRGPISWALPSPGLSSPKGRWTRPKRPARTP